MWEIVRAGGPLMWPIILCSIIAAAIILERLWTLQDKRVLPRELPQKVWQLIEANQINDKVIAALEQNSPLGRLLATGLANRHRPREILMERLEDTGRHVVHELERFINTLGTIAGVSPLLGLLGTVTGIIRSFNAIEAGGMGDPRALSGGIAEALIATVAGLVRGDPGAHRLSLPARAGRRHRGRDGEAGDPHGGRAGGGARARALEPRGRGMNLASKRGHEEPEINVVSLIDVVLLLVVFFILSSRFTDEGRLRVHLPSASAVPLEKVGSEPLVVSVTQAGTYLVNQRELINSSPETLRAALLKEAGSNRGMRVTLRADARATHQSVITAMDVLGRLGFAEVNIATIKEAPAGKP